MTELLRTKMLQIMVALTVRFSKTVHLTNQPTVSSEHLNFAPLEHKSVSSNLWFIIYYIFSILSLKDIAHVK